MCGGFWLLDDRRTIAAAGTVEHKQLTHHQPPQIGFAEIAGNYSRWPIGNGNESGKFPKK
jgi:hypothetical protein